MSTRKLYFISGSPPCWSVMLALEVKELNYTPVRLDNSKSEQNAPKFLAVNPRGQVPVLVDENGNGHGATFCETLSVLTYLNAAYPEPSLFGDTPTETARIWQSISECNSNLTNQVGDISRPLFRSKGAEFTEQIALAAEKVRAELALIETKLMTMEYLAGERLSAADLITYPIIMQLGRTAERDNDDAHALAIHPLAQYFPRIADWASRMEKIPGYANAYPPHWKP
jgi:glutathione S-transferase